MIYMRYTPCQFDKKNTKPDFVSITIAEENC